MMDNDPMDQALVVIGLYYPPTPRLHNHCRRTRIPRAHGSHLSSVRGGTLSICPVFYGSFPIIPKVLEGLLFRTQKPRGQEEDVCRGLTSGSASVLRCVNNTQRAVYDVHDTLVDTVIMYLKNERKEGYSAYTRHGNVAVPYNRPHLCQ